MAQELLDKYGNPLRRKPDIGQIVAKERLTRDTDIPLSGLTGVLAPTQDADWKLRSFTEEQLAHMEFEDILKVLVTASPDLARALNDFRMFVNTRWTLSVVEEDMVAEQILRRAIDTMRFDIGEPLSVKIDKLVASALLKGALYFETIFAETEFVDIVINDPLRVRFVQVEDDERRGQHWVRGEEQHGEFVLIDSPRVRYLPLNATDDLPYGRSMVSSGINPIVSRTGMMKDVRQAVRTQAIPYQKAGINRKTLTDSGLTAKDGTLGPEIERVEADIRAQFENAKPGTQFVFGSEVEIEIIGAMSRQNWDAVEVLDKIYQPQITQGTMQQPVISGLTTGNALSTNAEQQSEVWATQVDTLQTQIEGELEVAFTQILREQGNGATPIFELKRNTGFVQRARAERMEKKVTTLSVMLADGVITRQEYRDALRNPEAFDKLSDLLEPELPRQLADLPMPSAGASTPISGGPSDAEGDDSDE